MSEQAVERGPNYDWKHEAEHYRARVDEVHELLFKLEASCERAEERCEALQSRCARLEQALRLVIANSVNNDPIWFIANEALSGVETKE